MKQSTFKETGYREWRAEYEGHSFLIWKSYLWNDKGEWDYYTVDSEDEDVDYYFKVLARKPLDEKYVTTLCKKCLKNPQQKSSKSEWYLIVDADGKECYATKPKERKVLSGPHDWDYVASHIEYPF